MRLSQLTIVAALSVVAGVAVAVPASAQHGGRDDVRTSGSCSAGSTWQLKAKPDDGRIEVEFEVDSNRNGQTWAVALNDQGVRIFTGSRVTHAPSGSFSLERRAANRSGTDTFTAKARNTRTGEVCTGHISA
ncbi:hypothetical protein D1871_08740 [Nakamurella silvestris]|nr:hypothetical protein D1871_08740 [Nakamurella silvestris]